MLALALGVTGCSAGTTGGRLSGPVFQPVLARTGQVTFSQLQGVLDAFGPERGEGRLPDWLEQELRMSDADRSIDGGRIDHWAARYVGSVGRTAFYVSVAGSLACVHSGWENADGEFNGGSACGRLDDLLQDKEFVVAGSDSQTGMTTVMIPVDCRFRADGPVEPVALRSLVTVSSDEIHGNLLCQHRPSARIDLAPPGR